MFAGGRLERVRRFRGPSARGAPAAVGDAEDRVAFGQPALRGRARGSDLACRPSRGRCRRRGSCCRCRTRPGSRRRRRSACRPSSGRSCSPSCRTSAGRRSRREGCVVHVTRAEDLRDRRLRGGRRHQADEQARQNEQPASSEATADRGTVQHLHPPRCARPVGRIALTPGRVWAASVRGRHYRVCADRAA